LLLEENIKKISRKLKEKEGKFVFEYKYVEGSEEFQTSVSNFQSSMD
jgi:hypothetical protein